MNFLTLVNTCIEESKQALDKLESSNFHNPGRTVLYDRLKGWVSRSYQELVEERREWFFTNERGVVTVQPRLHLVVQDPSYIPQVGDTMVGEHSGVRFMLTEVFPDHEGYDNSEYTVGVTYDNVGDKNALRQWEMLSAQSGLQDYPEAARVEGRGTYDMSFYLPQINNINLNSITIQHSILDPDYANDMSEAVPPLRYMPWPQWERQFDNFYTPLGHPRFVTKTNSGDLQFYPFPDGLYDVSFEYDQRADELVEWSDIPSVLPEKHHMLLVWMALKELADFNNDRALFSRANKKYMERLGWLMRDNLPEMKMDTVKFYRGYY